MRQNEVKMMNAVGRSRLRKLLIAPVLAAAIVLAACGDDNDEAAGDAGGAGEGEPITIGYAIDQSGVLELYDTSALVAGEMAMDDINNEGGVDGRQLEAIDGDTAGEPAEAANTAIRLLDEGADVLIVACDFDLGGGAAAIEADRRGVLALSTCGASSKFGPEAAGELVFTMATSAAAQGAVNADFADAQGYERAFIIEETTADFYTQAADGFEQRWEELGGEVVGTDTMDNFQDRQFGPQISAIQSSDADFMFLDTFPPGGATFLRQARAAGVDLPVLASGDFDGDFWKEAVPGASDFWYGTYGSIYGDDPDDKVNELMDRYRQETGSRAELSLGIITGYSAVEAVARAIEQADGSTSGEELASVMEGWEGEEFVVGPTTFTDELHITPSREFRMMEVRDGETSYLETIEMEDFSIDEASE